VRTRGGGRGQVLGLQLKRAGGHREQWKHLELYQPRGCARCCRGVYGGWGGQGACRDIYIYIIYIGRTCARMERGPINPWSNRSPVVPACPPGTAVGHPSRLGQRPRGRGYLFRFRAGGAAASLIYPMSIAWKCGRWREGAGKGGSSWSVSGYSQGREGPPTRPMSH
jgi:hypothetical protein